MWTATVVYYLKKKKAINYLLELFFLLFWTLLSSLRTKIFFPSSSFAIYSPVFSKFDCLYVSSSFFCYLNV